ncbi:MAG: acetyl-coenzyme A synthetase 2 [Porticoccaceae bacterium]|nr:MAG: acetyl-coenzyme A synthetase 2 [Porticoccaceae bacterium]
MSQTKVYPVPAEWARRAWIDEPTYREMYRRSIEEPEDFWSDQARAFLVWEREWEVLCEADFRQGRARWFDGGRLNAAVNCLDRHLPARADQVAFYWEGDDPAVSATVTYRDLHERVCRFANALRARGVAKGDRVCIYLPMIPEAVVAMLACARIGAIHSVVFGGFSPDALRDRILDADCRVVVTADEGVRGGRHIPLKANADRALAECPNVHTLFVVRRTGGHVHWVEGRDLWYHEAVAAASPDCPAESMAAEDPLFILYTSGSTGRPKGVLHTTAGYLLQTAMSFRYVFDYRDGDVFWCTADVGWVTGHSYIVYGPLCNGATQVLFEGVPTHPDPSRFWQVCDRYRVNQFYTAPTAIRSLMAAGDAYVERCSLDSLRLLGTVGEPINPEAWEWYHRVVGKGRCPIVDTWWQTETGAHMITPLPGATALKPGSATLPFFGVVPALLDDEGREIQGPGSGKLVIKASWPSQLRTVYGDHQRLVDTYFRQHPGYYTTGDGARRDEDGYYWITGRIDDVLNVAGHRLGTAEIESALVLHPRVAEAAVVGFPHPIKGQGIYAFVTPMAGVEPTPELAAELVALCAEEIGPIAKPDVIQWAQALPKTRSGKIMRRILRKIAAGETEDFGDTSTLADPSVVEALVAGRPQS